MLPHQLLHCLPKLTAAMTRLYVLPNVRFYYGVRPEMERENSFISCLTESVVDATYSAC